VRSELRWPESVYSGMRLLCVGRHAYLSEHLCRYFRELGADCEPAVGARDAVAVATRYEPHAIVCDCDLITPALLEDWAREPTLTDVPLLAVSLTRRPEDLPPVELLDVAGVLYLPALEKEQVLKLLAGAERRRGVTSSFGWPPLAAPQSLPAR